jgi:hypothetical protein
MFCLEPSDLPRLCRLANQPHLTLALDAIAAGNTPAIAWVDNANQPRAAYLWDKAHCHFFVGDPVSSTFVQAVRELVRLGVAPKAVAQGKTFLKIFTSSIAWDLQIASIFEAVELVRRERVFLVLEGLLRPNWRAAIPAGFVVRQIDAELLACDGLRGIDVLREEIATGWHSQQDFLRAGFGFCLLGDDAIVTWCTAEYSSAGKCGVGVETAVEHMRRGYATLTASAFVEHAAGLGITPYWDSWKANLPSVAVARKVGFRLLTEYNVFTGRLRLLPE